MMSSNTVVNIFLLLSCFITVGLSLPEYFTAFKYEQETINNETRCYIHKYNFDTKFILGDTGESMTNYLPSASYESPCYDDYTYNEMNFMRDSEDQFYLVHCVFIPELNQSIKCDMFNKDGHRRIADFKCFDDNLKGEEGQTFYIADYLTGENPHSYLYGDAILYMENGGVCGKQVGYEPFNEVLDEFKIGKYNYWDAYSNEGYFIDSPAKRLIFRGKNHKVDFDTISYGTLNDKLRNFISEKNYDLVFNTDLTKRPFIFPDNDGYSPIGYNEVTNKWTRLIDGADYTDILEPLNLHKPITQPSLIPGKEAFEVGPHNIDYFWDRQKREVVVYKEAKSLHITEDKKYKTHIYREFPTQPVEYISTWMQNHSIYEELPGLENIHTNLDNGSDTHEISYTYGNGKVDWYYSDDPSTVDAFWNKGVTFDPIKNQLVEIDVEKLKVKLYERVQKTLEEIAVTKQHDYLHLVKGSHRLIKIKKDEKGPTEWFDAERNKQLEQVLNKEKNIAHVIDEIFLSKFIIKESIEA